MQGGMKKAATSKSAMARWKRSLLIKFFLSFFFHITKHTRELPAMLKQIITAKNTAYTKEPVEIAICGWKSFLIVGVICMEN